MGIRCGLVMGLLAAAIFLIIGQFAAIFTGVYLIRRMVRMEKQSLADRLTAFVSAPAEGQLSPFAEATELVAHRFAAQFTTQVFAKLQGVRGKVIQEGNALQADMFVDAASAQSPLLGMIASAFPSVTKRLAKNPTAMPALLNLLGNIRPAGSPARPSGSNGESVAGRIRNQT